MEFVISNHVRIHPMALVRFDKVADVIVRKEIQRLAAGYEDKTEYFVDKLARGLAQLCAVAYPKPAIIRMSDFKTNEYANLVGGAAFEPREANPMLGWRGASRYYSEGYKEGFALECKAVKRLREHMGFSNAIGTSGIGSRLYSDHPIPCYNLI
jgi:pyruvate,water dikinase